MIVNPRIPKICISAKQQCNSLKVLFIPPKEYYGTQV